MKCRTFSSYISRYLDGRLGSKASGMIEKHISECAGCGAELEKSQRLRKLMAAMPEQPLPDTLHRKIIGSIAAENMGKSKERKPLYPRVLVPVAAAFLALFLCLNMVRPDTPLLAKVGSSPCESYVAQDPELDPEGSSPDFNYIGEGIRDGRTKDTAKKAGSFGLYYYTKYGALLITSLTSAFVIYDWIKSKK